MIALLKLVAALLAALLIAVFGTVSFVKWKQASEAEQKHRQAISRVADQKREIEGLKSEIEGLEVKVRELEARLGGANNPDAVGACPAGGAPLAAENAEGKRAPLEMRYVAGVLKVFNTGASVRLAAGAGGRLKVGPESYELRQIHLVRPEGGALNGRPAALVAHLLHASESGETVIVSVPMRESAFQNRTVWQILNNLPGMGAPETTVDSVALDPNQLLPENRGYEVLRGSLSFQPCTANVRHYLLTNPVGVSKDQVDRFVTGIRAAGSKGAGAGSAPAGETRHPQAPTPAATKG